MNCLSNEKKKRNITKHLDLNTSRETQAEAIVLLICVRED